MLTEEHMAAIIVAGCENVQNSSGNHERVRKNMALCRNDCNEVSGHQWRKLIENNTTKIIHTVYN